MRISLLMGGGFLCVRGVESRKGKANQPKHVFFKVLYETDSMPYCEERNWEKYP